jgi:membrane protease YdiL (CAAX protease family)
VTAVFFSAIIFGSLHFSNALFLWCNPVLLLPQVIATTLLGLMFGGAKEILDGLAMPIGMHMGNNILAVALM